MAMTSRIWPTVGYIRWIAILYLIAALAAALITFFVVALLYATKGTLIFLAGGITGPVIYVIIGWIFGSHDGRNPKSNAAS
jgi:hypothetical protein